MTVFGGSAKYYDLLYGDKDTAAECAFVRGVIERHTRGMRSVLDLGCGSGRHVAEFAKAGLDVTGIDISEGMIALGQERVRDLPTDIRSRVSLAIGDVTKHQAAHPYDAVVSLFHVIDYQTTDEGLAGLFRSARQALGPGGMFVFDFWYGPAVEAQQPERREKRFESGASHVTRIAEPVLDVDLHVVDVHYTMTALDKRSGNVEDIREIHSMRYMFLPEIERFAADAGFDIVEHGEWLSRAPLSDRTWSGYAAARVR